MIESKVDERGRILIPKNVREDLKLDPKDTVVFIKEIMGYVIIPRERYIHPTKALEKLAVKGSGHPNPKKEAREWMLSQQRKSMEK